MNETDEAYGSCVGCKYSAYWHYGSFICTRYYSGELKDPFETCENYEVRDDKVQRKEDND